MIASVLVKRVGMAIVTLFGVAVVVFLLIRVAPGDPLAMMIGPGATKADIAALRAHYGFDKPLIEQFFIWLWGVVRGDFGASISLHRKVLELLADRLPATLELATAACAIAVLLGGAAAIVGTLWRQRAGEA
ncbi:MAG: ABC transporter permease, partial [Pseudolabrys sp.]